jgi:phospholipase/lecithinase/hemolysin
VLSTLSQQHNAALATALLQLAQLPGLELIPIDVNVALSHLPATTNTTIPALSALFPPPGPGEIPVSLCLLLDPSACQDVPTFNVDLKYLFWDVQHPTTDVHRLIAEQIYAALLE